MAEFWLSEEQFARLAPLLPTDTRGVAGGRPAGDFRDRARADERRAVVGRAGLLRAEEDALQSLGALGAEGCVAAGIRGAGRERRAAGRAHARLDLGKGAPLGSRRKRGALANAIGRSRGGPTTRLHALVDGYGRLVAFLITPGQRGDAPVAAELIGLAPAPATLAADPRL